MVAFTCSRTKIPATGFCLEGYHAGICRILSLLSPVCSALISLTLLPPKQPTLRNFQNPLPSHPHRARLAPPPSGPPGLPEQSFEIRTSEHVPPLSQHLHPFAPFHRAPLLEQLFELLHRKTCIPQDTLQNPGVKCLSGMIGNGHSLSLCIFVNFMAPALTHKGETGPL